MIRPNGEVSSEDEVEVQDIDGCEESEGEEDELPHEGHLLVKKRELHSIAMLEDDTQMENLF